MSRFDGLGAAAAWAMAAAAMLPEPGFRNDDWRHRAAKRKPKITPASIARAKKRKAQKLARRKSRHD